MTLSWKIVRSVSNVTYDDSRKLTFIQNGTPKTAPRGMKLYYSDTRFYNGNHGSNSQSLGQEY